MSLPRWLSIPGQKLALALSRRRARTIAGLSRCRLIISGLALLSSPGLADELSRSDKLKVLYSNRFAFDRRGVPLITVRVAEGLDQAVIASPSHLRVLPDGEDGSAVSGGKRWRVTLKRSKPGVLAYFVELEREPISALAKLRRAMLRWQKQGVACQLIEVGTVFGVQGTVFDSRSLILAHGPFPDTTTAQRAAKKLRHQLVGQKIAIIPQLRQRPSATLEALDLDTSARVKVQDALWFATSAEQQITVHAGSGKPRAYWGQIYLTVNPAGKMVVVNAIAADRLLAGLVPAEIFAQAPHAALRAQAVAARGELLAKIGIKHIADPYLLCSTQHCQVYAGAGYEHPRATKAVQDTRGMVLLKDGGDRLVDTVYSASCGGHSEHNDQAWSVQPDPNLRGHLDGPVSAPALRPWRHGITESNIEQWLGLAGQTWCGSAKVNQDKYRWRVNLTAAQVNQMVRTHSLGPIKNIRVLQRGISGRAVKIALDGQRGTREVEGELRIRRLFGNLRSSMFVVKIERHAGQPTGFTFSGGGWGHGVGMCQTGAIGMAHAKKSYQEILNHYYLHSVLKQLY